MRLAPQLKTSLIRARYTAVLARAGAVPGQGTQHIDFSEIRDVIDFTFLIRRGFSTPRLRMGTPDCFVESGGCRDCFAASIVSIVLSLHFLPSSSAGIMRYMRCGG